MLTCTCPLHTWLTVHARFSLCLSRKNHASYRQGTFLLFNSSSAASCGPCSVGPISLSNPGLGGSGTRLAKALCCLACQEVVACHCSTWNSTCRNALTLAGCLQGAYLLAVLAENPCTHQCLKAEGCVELLLHLMHHGGPRAARAANAAVVSLATNADNHFGLVSLGLAPALVATLQAGKSSHTASGARCMLHKFLRMMSLVLGFVLGARPQQGNPVLALCA